MIQTSSEYSAALKELSSIRRIMQNAAAMGQRPRGPSAIDAAITIHAIALVLALSLLINDLGFYPFISPPLGATRILELSAQNSFLRIFLIAASAVLLLLLSTGLYTILWSAARRDGETLPDYVARNFAPYSILSFLSDLAIKFVAITISVAAQRPEWVSPLLILFTADYLFQGRFFSFRFQPSVIFGAVAILIGMAQLLAREASLSVALAVFLMVASVSLASLLREKRVVLGNDSSEVEA